MLLRSENRKNVWIGTGLVAAVGAGAGVLMAQGNPGNMGICGACFLRDTAGSLGLFATPKLQIMRPEVLGLILGAFLLVLLRGKASGRSGGYASARFFFGVFMAFGALVFLGCPFRMFQRIGGGDANAMIAALGLIAGVGVGLLFEKRGYSIGKTATAPLVVGLQAPLMAIGIGLLFLNSSLVGPGPGAASGPPHAPWVLALCIAMIAGALLSLTGFCGISATRQLFGKPRGLLLGAAALIVAFGIVAAGVGKFNFGFEGQPAAHSDHLWSILGMALVGLTGVLTGGCPVRQMVMAGEGNADAFMTVAGLLVGGALAHTLGIASSGKGVTAAGQLAVVVGLVLSIAFMAGVTMSKSKSAAA